MTQYDAECLACDARNYPWTLFLYAPCCPRRPLDLSAHFNQAWSVDFQSFVGASSTADICLYVVTLGGAVLFLIFGVIYSYEAWYWDEVAEAAADVLRR